MPSKELGHQRSNGRTVKRLDKQVHLPVEERTWQIHVPVPNTKGILAVRTPMGYLSKAEEEVMELRVTLKQGGSVLPMPVEEVVERFLKSSGHVSVRSGKERMTQVEELTGRGMLGEASWNYLVPFLGADQPGTSRSPSGMNGRMEGGKRHTPDWWKTLGSQVKRVGICGVLEVGDGELPHSILTETLSPGEPHHRRQGASDTWEPHDGLLCPSCP